MTRPGVLFVDDEPNILDAYARQLRRQFEIRTCDNPRSALGLLAGDGPFGVVVSDFRMPEMDGVQFLREVRRRHPEITRIMLTGQADYQATIDAVNQGNIFRFLSKPCAPEDLAVATEDAMQLHELVMAEKELIEGTLKGTISVLSELVGLTSPDALARSARVRDVVACLTKAMGLEDVWVLDVAASLSQIGCLTLPHNLVTDGLAGTALVAKDREMYEGHPLVGKSLLARIPRLQGVATLVGSQFTGPLTPRQLMEANLDEATAEVFTAAVTFCELSQHLGARTAIDTMMQRAVWGPLVIDALTQYASATTVRVSVAVTVDELLVGMVTDQDIVTNSGVLLVAARYEITSVLLARLHNFHRLVGIVEPVKVLVDRR